MERITNHRKLSKKTLGINQYITQLTKTCKCGKTFVGDGRRKYCSEQCAKYQKQQIKNICIECGNSFVGNSRKKYCSSQCKNTNESNQRLEYKRVKPKRRKKELLERSNIYLNGINGSKEETIMEVKKKQYIPKPLKIKTCKNCDNSFLTNNKKKVYCSKECRQQWFKIQYDLIPFEDKIKNSLLKLRFEIFKRDNFTCQYCGRNVKIDKVKLNIEHIIPKALGGTNDIDNLNTSCVACNLGKRDTLLEDRQLKKEMIYNETKF